MTKKKRVLGIVLIVALLLAAALVIALFADSGEAQKEAGQSSQSVTSEAVTEPESSVKEPVTEERSQQAETETNGEVQDAVCENGMFTFSAGQFRDRFADSLPEGYQFTDKTEANAGRDGRLQLGIREESGVLTDCVVLLNVNDPEVTCQQMALVIKADEFVENAEVLLEWYLTTFMEELEAEEQRRICEDCLDMFVSESEDYRVYSSDSLVVMMGLEAEADGDYYYVLASAQ